MRRIAKALPILLTTLAGGWASGLVSTRVRAGMREGLDPEAIITGLAGMAGTPMAVDLDRTGLLWILAGMAAVALFWLYRWSKGQDNYRDREEYGSARWAGPDEMSPYTDRDPRQNLQMTASEGLSIDAAATRRNRNTLVIGSSGSGKTATHVIPNILNANMSYAATDPKGELYERTHEALERKGYAVCKLDLVDLSPSTRFNPLDYIDPDKPDVSIMRLVTNIMENTNGTRTREAGGDGFWDKAERSLLTALIALVYYVPEEIMRDEIGVDSGRTLNAVADLAGRMEASEEDESRESVVDLLVGQCSAAYDRVRAAWDADPSRHDDPAAREEWAWAQGLRFAATQYRPFTQGAGETKKSIIISLGVRLAPVQVGPVRDILSDDTIGIDDIGGYEDEDDGTCTRPKPRRAVFLALPDEDPTFNFIAAIYYQCLFDSIIRRCRSYPGQRLAGSGLHCFLDEFANVGRIPNFDRLIATIRSRGVSVSVILQTIAQLKAMYKDSWETIAGNCDSTLFLGGDEPSTTEWVSKILGKETIDTRTTSESKGVNGSWTVNHQRAGRELLTPDELGHLDNDRCIYLLRGLHPFLSRKVWPGTRIRRPRSTLRHSKGWRPAD